MAVSAFIPEMDANRAWPRIGSAHFRRLGYPWPMVEARKVGGIVLCVGVMCIMNLPGNNGNVPTVAGHTLILLETVGVWLRMCIRGYPQMALTFDRWQFDRPDYARLVDAAREIGDEGSDPGYRLSGRDWVKKETPDWALTWAGLARVALMLSPGIIQAKRRGPKPNHARRVSVAYLYFRACMPYRQIADYLNVTEGSVLDLIHHMRNYLCAPLIYEGADLRQQVTILMQNRDEGQKGTNFARVHGAKRDSASSEDAQEKAIERECREEIAETMRQDGLARLGAHLRPRRRGLWKTSDNTGKIATWLHVRNRQAILTASRIIRDVPLKTFSLRVQPLPVVKIGIVYNKPRSKFVTAGAGNRDIPASGG